MSMWLRQSTASQEVLLGPFVDDTDGKTAETGLTIANTDIKLWVEGATTEASKNSGGATHIASGRYYCVLDATDTATLGKLEINVHVSGALPVRREFMVVPANVYDSVVLGTDDLEVDAKAVSGDTTAADNLELAFDGTGYGFTNCTMPTVTTLTGHTAQTGDTYAELPTNFVDMAITDTTGYVTATLANGAHGGAAATLTLSDYSDFLATGFSTHAAADVWSVATRVLTAGTNLNDLSAADVNAEVDAAIETYHLDHLLAVDYDPASPPGIATALLNELVENDAGVARFTVNALENAPSGSGASAETIADAVWDEVLTSGTHDVGYSAGQRLRYLILTGSQAQAGAANSITLANTESAEDYIFNQNILSIVGGTGAGQTRLIAEYNGTTKVAIVDTVWHVTPDNTSIYEVLPFSSILLADHGVAQGGAAGSLTLAATASSDDASYVGSLAYISSGTGDQQSRLITAYNGTTKVALISPNWVTTPDATSVYKVLPVGRVIVDSISETTESDIVDAVWDEPTTGHVTAGTFGEQVKTDVDAILADTNELQADWANGGRLDLILDELTTQGDTNETKIDTVDGVVDTILVDTNELQTNQGNWATATTVDLNVDQSGVTIGTVNALATSAITDVWATDALTESYAADGAAPTPAQALYLIQQALTEFAITTDTITVKKLDGSTTAATFTMDDDTTPTSRTRAT